VSRGGKVHAPFTSAVGGHLIIPAILTSSALYRAMIWLRRRKMFDPYLVLVVYVVYEVALVEVFLHAYFYLSIFFQHCCVNLISFTWHWRRIALVTKSVVKWNTSFPIAHRCAALVGKEGLCRGCLETVIQKVLYASHTFLTNLPSTSGFIPVGGQHVCLLAVVAVVVVVDD